MKIKLYDRLYMALIGLILLASACVIVVDGLGVLEILSRFDQFLHNAGIPGLAVAVVPLLLAVSCFQFVFRRNKKNTDFVMQKTTNGELSISIKTIDGLIRKCVSTHDEMILNDAAIESYRDGLVITLKIVIADNISIPLAAAALQKQMKQYITASTGVDVKDVCVMVESSDSNVDPGTYRLHELRQDTNGKVPAEIPPVETEVETEAPKPFHERLFHREADHVDDGMETLETPAVQPEQTEASDEAVLTDAAETGCETEKVNAETIPDEKPYEEVCAADDPEETAAPVNDDDLKTKEAEPADPSVIHE